MSKGNRKMPPDTYRCPDMVISENTLWSLSCPDHNFDAERPTHLEWIFCQLSDGPNFVLRHFEYSLCNALGQYLEQAVALLGRFRCAC
jgi:hypothetical protein